jgi:hypothetical protein
MVSFDTSEGMVTLPDTLVRAVVRHAQREADFLAGVLKELGLAEARLPAAFLLEFAALLQLWYWEWQDLRRYLPDDVSTFAEAKKSLCDRAINSPAEFAGLDAIPLSRHVLKIWLENFAWDAWGEFSADLIVSQTDEDQFVESLAEFLWKHRNELANLLGNQETHP